MASLTGPPAALDELISAAVFPEPHEAIGPVPLEDGAVRALIRVPRDHGNALAARLHEAAASRSARKAADAVRIVLDPIELF